MSQQCVIGNGGLNFIFLFNLNTTGGVVVASEALPRDGPTTALIAQIVGMGSSNKDSV